MFQKKKWHIFVTVGLCLAVVITLFLNVGISGEPLMAGGAVCISFDKWDMLRADKIVIGHREETHTITDPDFIKSFCKETLAGTYHEYCCSDLDEGWAEIYRGDRLVRRMRFIANHDAFAYEADIAHWVLFGKEGHSFLSNDLRDQLNEMMYGK